MIQANLKEIKSYLVRKVPEGALLINGTGNDPHWEHADVLTDFSYPWESEKPPATAFRALHDKEWLFMYFYATDPDVNVYIDKNHKLEVDASDRVEVFFRINDKLNPYYGLEIDPSGRVLDYKASYHRKFDMDWQWPAGELKIKTSRTADGYRAEFAVSKKSLNDLKLLNGNKLEAGVFRGNCVALKDREATMKWISWMKPMSDTPDFHIPSAFGLFTLEE